MTEPLKPLEIIEIARVVAALQVVSKGDFAEEIKVLDAKAEELKRQYGVIPTLDEAKKRLDEAAGQAVAAKAAREAESQKAARLELDLVEGTRKLKAATQDADAAKLDYISKQRQLEKQLRENNEAHAKRMQELSDRAERLRVAEEKLRAEEKKVADKLRNIKSAAAA